MCIRDSGQKAAAAHAVGAEAVIVYNNAAGPLNGTLGGVNPDSAPATGVTQEVGQALLAKMANGPVTMSFVLDKTMEERETFNVLAETKTGRDDNVVMVGAHLDGAPEGAGINDNGSGSAGILETAVQIGKAKKLNNKVRFAWWGAEELGLIGSDYYVQDLVDNDPAELEDIATYLNFDMIASPNHIIGVYDADESTYEAPVEVPAGSAETEDVFTDYFDGINQPWSTPSSPVARTTRRSSPTACRPRASSPAPTARRRPRRSRCSAGPRASRTTRTTTPPRLSLIHISEPTRRS